MDVEKLREIQRRGEEAEVPGEAEPVATLRAAYEYASALPRWFAERYSAPELLRFYVASEAFQSGFADDWDPETVRHLVANYDARGTEPRLNVRKSGAVVVKMWCVGDGSVECQLSRPDEIRTNGIYPRMRLQVDAEDVPDLESLDAKVDAVARLAISMADDVDNEWGNAAAWVRAACGEMVVEVAP